MKICGAKAIARARLREYVNRAQGRLLKLASRRRIKVESMSKEWKWEVIRVNGITVASGYKCPDCGCICVERSCHCKPLKPPEKK